MLEELTHTKEELSDTHIWRALLYYKASISFFLNGYIYVAVIVYLITCYAFHSLRGTLY